LTKEAKALDMFEMAATNEAESKISGVYLLTLLPSLRADYHSG